MYTALIVYLIAAIGISFFCSMLEAALLSTTPSYTQAKLNEGSRTGKLLNEFKNNIDRPLSAILTLNTIANTFCAIGVGKEASKLWPNHITVTTLFVPIAMTFAILVFSEITPKTIGANNWKRLAPFTAKERSVSSNYSYARDLVFAGLYEKKFLMKNNDNKEIFSRADFLAMADIGSSEGELDEVESKTYLQSFTF